jgi:TRAP-type C4-dicarboxylate transport system permease small subunit
MKGLRRILVIFDQTNDLLGIWAGAITIFIMLWVCASVVLRVIRIGLVYMSEIPEYCLLFITFLGTTWLLKREGHVKTDMLLARLNPRTQAALNTITSVLVAITCLVLALFSARVTWQYFQVGYYLPSGLKPPKAPIMAIIPVGFFLLFIQFLRRAYRYLGEWGNIARQKPTPQTKP